MPRILEIRVTAYKFSKFPNLLYHSNKWWFNGAEIPEIFNNGSLCFLIAGRKYGKNKFLKERRKDAIKCTIIIDNCPF